MDMYWPGTTAAAERSAGFEAESAPPISAPRDGRIASAPVPEPARTPGGVTLSVARRAPVLPCTSDPDLFFAESPEGVETAKAMCQGCPVRLTCLAGALERREPWGVWGGELFLRGEVVPRKRPRGRPRKSEVAA
jgi:WhiB family redox-sensing transcriptional regulator